MKKILFFLLSSICLSVHSQNPGIMCFPNQQGNQPQPGGNIQPKSINDLKIVRINFHFMLKTNGTGNFNEVTDGDGRYYSGYDYARTHVSYMNSMCNQNFHLNIPTGNVMFVPYKKYRFVLDAVYFWRNDATYNFQTINYGTQGKDKDSVMNIFLSYGTQSSGGYASDLSTSSHIKYTETTSYWYNYKGSMAGGGDGGAWPQATTTCHELGHLLSLSHTVQYNGSAPCPTGCGGIYGNAIDYTCDDGCADTPTAWEIMQANNCTTHPACGWSGGLGGWTDCSNNLMDYTGDYALSSCQIGKIHSALENGLRSYLSCAAVSKDMNFPDLGYPKLSYFGKNIVVGSAVNFADITNQEKIAMYYSSSVELNNFEVRADSEFEVILEGVCGF